MFILDKIIIIKNLENKYNIIIFKINKKIILLNNNFMYVNHITY